MKGLELQRPLESNGSSRDTKPARIVVLASVPPPIAGQSAATAILLSALDEQETDYCVIDIGDRISGRSRLSDRLRRSAAVFSIWAQTARLGRSTSSKSTTMYLQLGQSFASMLRDIPLLTMARLFGWKRIVHVHGGGWRAAYDRLPPVARPIYRSLVRRVDGFVVLTPRLRKMTAGVVPDSAVAVIGNGVESEIEQASQANPATLGPEPVVLFLSNLLPGKGADTVVEAARRAHARGDATLFVLAGSAPTGEEPVRLPPNAKFVGSVTGQAKYDLFRSASVFVLPTAYPVEGEPISILEAMHFGLPVISCDQGGIADLVGPENGTLIEYGNPEALLSAVNEICEDPSRWSKISMANRQKAAQEHSSAAHQERMIAFLLDEPVTTASEQHK